MKTTTLDFHGLDVVIDYYDEDNEIEIANIRAFHKKALLNEYFTDAAWAEMAEMLYTKIFVQGDHE
jgi:hypothetical protein